MVLAPLIKSFVFAMPTLVAVWTYGAFCPYISPTTQVWIYVLFLWTELPAQSLALSDKSHMYRQET